MFWGLLDEAHGEDGQQFLFHCLSIALSLGGAQLWYQLGWPLFQVLHTLAATPVITPLLPLASPGLAPRSRALIYHTLYYLNH